MTTIQRRRIARLLLAACILTWAPQSVLAAAEAGRNVNLAQALRRSLLVFPVDTAAANVPGKAEVSSLLTEMARSRLIASDAYAVALFHRSLPTIARLVNDQQLSDSDISEPFAEDNAKSVKVAKAAGYDLVFVGSVDNYEEANNTGNMTVSGRIIEVNTGRILRSATLSAQSGTGQVVRPEDRALDAARSAGEKLMTQLVPTIVRPDPGVQPRVPSGKSVRSRNNNWLLGVLAVGLIVGIASSASGGGGGSGTGFGGGPSFGSPGGGNTGGDFPPAPPR